MPLALSDLVKEETRDEVLGTLLTIAADVDLKVTAWQPGQPIRTFLTLVAQKVADITLLSREAIKGGLLDYAEKEWLTLLALSLYRVTRRDAKAAEGDSLSITNASDETYNVNPGDLIVAHAVTGKTYRNKFAFAIPAGATIDIDDAPVTILADEAGTGSDAAPGQITALVSSLDGVTITNTAAILGADAETDPELRDRCRDKLGSLSPNGPKEAYAFVSKTPALAAVGVAITRVLVVPDPVTGELTVFLATANGAPSGGDVTIVDTALDKWATPWCTSATAAAATNKVINVTCQVWVKGSSLTPAQIQSAVAVALAAYFKSLPIGGDKIAPDTRGKVRVGNLELVVGKATTGIVKVEVTIPAADVELVGLADGDTTAEVATLGVVTTTVTVLS